MENVSGKYFVVLNLHFSGAFVMERAGGHKIALFDDEESAHFAAGPREHQVFKLGEWEVCK